MKNKSLGRTIALISAVVLAVSAFLPWGGNDLVSVNGLEGDGMLTIPLAVVVFLLMLFAKKKKGKILTIVLGIVAIAIGFMDYGAMSEAAELISGKVGIGIYLTILSGFGILIGSALSLKCKFQ
jgi:hypothetical protein